MKLLDKIRGHDELQVLINKTGADSEQETYELLARLKLAIRYREKRVGGPVSCHSKTGWTRDIYVHLRSGLVFLVRSFDCLFTFYNFFSFIFFCHYFSFFIPLFFSIS